MNVAQFVCSVTVGSHLDRFQFGANVDRAATNILLHTCFGECGYRTENCWILKGVGTGVGMC